MAENVVPDELSRDNPEITFQNWIMNAEAEFNKVKADYETARQYKEHDQKPSGVPTDKEYIEENLLTDYVNRLQGSLIGGKFSPVLKGGGGSVAAYRELFLEILDENKFKESLIETLSDYFYTEGYAGIKVTFNPFKRTAIGLGLPEVFMLRPDSLMLDNNSIELKHGDDRYRIHRVKLPLEVAYKRYPQFKDKIAQSTEGANDSDTEDYCDLYEIHFKKTVTETGDDGIKEEMDKFYIARMINKTVLVKRPQDKGFIEESRFNRWSLIPVFHTPRSQTRKYPIGPVERLKDTQDQLNITSSVILDAVKASIKMQAIVAGATVDEQKELQDNLAKPTGIGFIKSTQSKVFPLLAQPLVRPVVEWHQMCRDRFRDISGKFQPDTGDQIGDQSGRAIALLQHRGDMPEYVAKAHIEEALTEMGWLIFECIKKYMVGPMAINRNVNGEDKQIYFNTPATVDMDEINVPDRDAIVNSVESLPLDSMKFAMEVEMNLLQKQEIEMNKAILMRGQQSLSLKDFMEIMYPHTWKEKLENVTKENKVLGLVQQLGEASPELLDQAIATIPQILNLTGQTPQSQ